MAFQDFTTYTEVDPAGDYTITATKIDISSIQRVASAYVYSDFGAAFFNNSFEHLMEFFLDSTSALGERTNIWAMTNDVGDQDELDLASVSFFCASIGDEAPNTLRRLYEYDGVDAYADTANDAGMGFDVVIYGKVERDEDVGSFGTLYFSQYSDSERTTLISTQTITLHTSKKDFEYLYGTMSDGRAGTNTWTGYVQNLDIGGAAVTHDLTLLGVGT